MAQTSKSAPNAPFTSNLKGLQRLALPQPACHMDKLQDLSAFLVKLDSTLARKASNLDTSATVARLLPDVEKFVQLATLWISARKTPDPAHIPRHFELSSRNLWNLCVRLRRDSVLPSPGGKGNIVLHAWLLSAVCIELSHTWSDELIAEQAREKFVLRLVLSIAKASINDSELHVARLALQRGAAHVNELGHSCEDDDQCRQRDSDDTLLAEYYTMRIWLSWQEDRPDVAEHMYQKASMLRHHLKAESAETMADVLQRIGTGLYSRDDRDLGLKWLERAYDLLKGQGQQLSSHGQKLYIAICNDMMEALHSAMSHECLSAIEAIIETSRSILCNHPVLYHWWMRAQDNAADASASEGDYADALQKLILSSDLSNEFLPHILSHTRTLADRSPQCVAHLLQGLLLHKGNGGGKPDWIGKILFIQTWIASKEASHAANCESLSDSINTAYEHVQAPLPRDAVEACHALMWKLVQFYYTTGRLDDVELWCELALRPLFRREDGPSVSKFVRKLFICGMMEDRMPVAWETFYGSSSACGDDMHLTHYMSLKSSLAGWNQRLCAKSIRSLVQSGDINMTRDFLYACLAQVSDACDRVCVVEALKSIINQWDTKKASAAASAANLPLLLRCTIRVLQRPGRGEPGGVTSWEESQLADDICEMFELAAKHAAAFRTNTEQQLEPFAVPELDWFRKNSYNMGVLKAHEWKDKHIIGILGSCLSLISCYPSGLPRQQTAEITLTALRCHFALSATHLRRARDQPADRKRGHYERARRHVSEFGAIFRSREIDGADGKVEQDVLVKMSTLLVYDFEAATQLAHYADLNVIVACQKPLKQVVAFKAMGDILLQSAAPAETLSATLRSIINEIYALEAFDAAKLAQYLGSVFLSLLDANDGLALRVVDEVSRVASECSRAERPLPSAEMEWLVARTFNHAVDLYARADEGACRDWAAKAMQLAALVDDKGALSSTLQRKFAELRFGGGWGGGSCRGEQRVRSSE